MSYTTDQIQPQSHSEILHAFGSEPPNSHQKVMSGSSNRLHNGITDFTDLERRIQQLESMISSKPNGRDDLDELFNFEEADPPKEEAGEPTSKPKIASGFPNICLKLWGGPIMPADDQSLW